MRELATPASPMPAFPENVPAPAPVPPEPRRSGRERIIPTHPDNVYGESWHPVDIERDNQQALQREKQAKRRQQQPSTSTRQPIPSRPAEQNPPPSQPAPSTSAQPPATTPSTPPRPETRRLGPPLAPKKGTGKRTLLFEDIRDLATMAEEGGVKLINFLLAKAVLDQPGELLSQKSI